MKKILLLLLTVFFLAPYHSLSAQGGTVFPPIFQALLAQNNYDYQVGPNATAISPRKIVVEFQPTVSLQQQQLVRDSLGVVSYVPCMCSVFIQEWDFGGTLPPNGILGKKADADADPAVKSADYSYYTFDFTAPGAALPPSSPLAAPPVGASPVPGGAPLIAILDTGVDFAHDSLQNYIWLGNEPANGGDDDGDCLVDDFIGWNFVQNNNNPNDDHGHGTHVAGTVVRNLLHYSPGCDFRIMPLKTHDRNGISTMFNVICATYYAAMHGATIINDSWGWYGGPSALLEDAITFAETNAGALVLAAAGNDGVNITVQPHFPSNYALPNVVSVMYIDSAFTVPAGANFSPTDVDIAHFGQGVYSTFPGNNFGFSTGSSMATPGAAAAAAALQCCFNPAGASALKNLLLAGAIPELALNNRCITEGRVRFPNPNCGFCTLQGNFTATPSPVNCQTIRFSSQVSGGTGPYTYAWDFGAQGTSTLSNPAFTYPSPGQYVACVTITDATGCSLTRCRSVTVGGGCLADSLDFCTAVEPFAASGFRVKVNDVTFQCNGSALVRYSFDNGLTWTASNAQVFSTPGNYSVCVRLTCTFCGQNCVLTCCKEVQVGTPCSIMATANLVVNPVVGGGPATLIASVLSPSAQAYEWDFNNDGTIDATTASNQATFNYGVGNHEACVTIRRSPTCEKRICRSFVVNTLCNVTANMQFRRCSADSLTLQFSALVNNATAGVLWDFGDGATSTALQPQHAYVQPGTYTVCLTAYRSPTCFTRVCYTITL